MRILSKVLGIVFVCLGSIYPAALLLVVFVWLITGRDTSIIHLVWPFGLVFSGGLTLLGVFYLRDSKLNSRRLMKGAENNAKR